MKNAEFADRVARNLHRRINGKRRKSGSGQLEGRTPLIEAARSHSRVMAREGRIFHHGPDGGPQDRAPAGYSQIAENAAYCYKRGSPRDVAGKLYKQWIGSPGHRKNMLDSSYKYDGIGIWVTRRRVYATHKLARNGPLFGGGKGENKNFETPDLWSLPNLDPIWRKLTPRYSIRERQWVYGLIFGVVAIFGCLLTLGLTRHPDAPTIDLASSLRYFIFTNSVLFERATDGGMQAILQFLVRVPTFVVVLSMVLCAAGISRTSRLRYLFENTAPAGFGFLVYILLGMYLLGEQWRLDSVGPLVTIAASAWFVSSIALWVARKLPN